MEGCSQLARRGIVPVVNVFHRDPKADLAQDPRAEFADLKRVALYLQDIYLGNGFQAFFDGYGRNSIDGEAARGRFA